MSEPTRYRFGPRERRGLIAGWRGGQIAAAVAGLLLAVVAVRSYPNVAGAGLALVVVIGAIGFACWPVGGRTGEEWFPTVVRWTSEVAAGSRFRQSSRPSQGARHGSDGVLLGISTVIRRQRGTIDGSTVFSGISVLGWGGGTRGDLLGVVKDSSARTYSAALSLRGHSFSLLSPDEKERRVHSWSALLASLSREGSLVHRLQWIASTIPDDGEAATHYLEDRRVVPVDSEVHQSYESLLSATGIDACRHQVLLVVQVRDDRGSSRSIRAAGGGVVGACTVLQREVETLRGLLGEADIPVERILGPDALCDEFQRNFVAQPVSTPTRPSRVEGTSSSKINHEPRDPWPMAIDQEWGLLRTDATFHATYWVAEWPRTDVGTDFLASLILGTARRSISIVMEPLSPSKAVRQVEQARTADLADGEIRRRGGFLTTARRTRETDVVTRREAELAEGHASFRYSGFVTVTASSRQELIEAMTAAEHAAGQCRLELRRLYGDQSRAFTCVLPLGRGLQ